MTLCCFNFGRKKGLDKPTKEPAKTNIVVIGAGLMGSGIAQVSSEASYNVVLTDSNEKALASALPSIQKNLGRVAKKKFPDNEKGAADYVNLCISRIKPVPKLEAAVQKADIVIEAVVENYDVKNDVFSRIDKNSPATAVLATNTSSLSVGRIAQAVRDPSRVGGLHFFNPVPVMKLVELVVGPRTSAGTANALSAFAQTLGKKLVHCKDTPGFVVNRLLVPYLADAIRMLERGDASLLDIDAAMPLSCGYPMGPFTLLDYVGLDTTAAILKTFSNAYPTVDLFRVPAILEKLVAGGFTGAKSPKGGFLVQGAPNPQFFDADGKLRS